MLADVVARTRPAVVVVWGHAWHRSSPNLLAAVSPRVPYRPVVIAADNGWPADIADDPDVLRCPTLADTAEVVTLLVAGDGTPAALSPAHSGRDGAGPTPGPAPSGQNSSSKLTEPVTPTW
jgi:hypothetical protein